VSVIRGFLKYVKSSCNRRTTNILLLQEKVVIQEIASSVDKVNIKSDTQETRSTILWAIPQTVSKIKVIAMANH